MNSPLPLLPIVLPLGLGVALLFPLGRFPRALLSLFGTLLTLIASITLLWATSGGAVLTSSLGGWTAPYGIVMVGDRLSALMSVLGSVAATLCIFYTLAKPDSIREKYGQLALLQLLFGGVQLSFITGDLFNLFVAFEVMLVASYALAVLGSTRDQLREGFRYIVMNLAASVLLVVTAGLVYGVLGTLNFAHLAQRSAELGPNATVTSLMVLLLLVFSAKGALFPLGFWLPGTYPAVPPAVSTFFAAVLTKVGMYAALRLTLTVFSQEPEVARAILLLLGSVTMLTGALGAITQREWRRVLSFTVMSSVGYLAYGAGLSNGGEAAHSALSATLYYLMGSVLVTAALFLIAAVAETLSGQADVRVRGFIERRPWLAAAFLVCALTLAGLPPSAGFVAKFGLVRAGLAQGGPLAYAATTCALVASLLLLYAMLGVWRGFFWGRSTEGFTPRPLARAEVAPVMLASALVCALAVGAGPLYAVAQQAAGQLKAPQIYRQSVLPPSLLTPQANQGATQPTALPGGKP